MHSRSKSHKKKSKKKSGMAKQSSDKVKFPQVWPLSAQDDFESLEDEDSEEDSLTLSFSGSEKSPTLTIALCAVCFTFLFFLNVCIVML